MAISHRDMLFCVKYILHLLQCSILVFLVTKQCDVYIVGKKFIFNYLARWGKTQEETPLVPVLPSGVRLIHSEVYYIINDYCMKQFSNMFNMSQYFLQLFKFI